MGTLRECAEARRFIFKGNARLDFVLHQFGEPTADAEISPDVRTQYLLLTVRTSQSGVKKVFI